MTRHHRDIITIGASSGGVEAVLEIASGLPEDLPAAVFIVIHVAPGFRSQLPGLLTRRGRLPATHALHGEPIEAGHIYVAPPDNHLLLRPGYLDVIRGPKENGHRPSVDALFRTASLAYGPRVIGVVLTGNLDCGTVGLLSIKARGGLAVVQDPAEAAAAEMPSSALRNVAVDHVAGLQHLPALLARLTRSAAVTSPKTVPEAILAMEGDKHGLPAEIVCPTCQRSLSEARVGDFSSFRCHAGHALSLSAMVAGQSYELEQALWGAVRALQEAAKLTLRIAERSYGDFRARLLDRAQVQNREAETIRRILLADTTVVDPP